MINEEFKKFKDHKSVKPWSIDVFNKENWLNGTWKTFTGTPRNDPTERPLNTIRLSI